LFLLNRERTCVCCAVGINNVEIVSSARAVQTCRFVLIGVPAAGRTVIQRADRRSACAVDPDGIRTASRRSQVKVNQSLSGKVDAVEFDPGPIRPIADSAGPNVKAAAVAVALPRIERDGSSSSAAAAAARAAAAGAAAASHRHISVPAAAAPGLCGYDTVVCTAYAVSKTSPLGPMVTRNYAASAIAAAIELLKWTIAINVRSVATYRVESVCTSTNRV